MARWLFPFLACALVSVPVWAVTPEELLAPSLDLAQESLDAALRHALTRREPFLRSYQMRDPDSLNHFFTRADYRLLAGNPLFGYFHVGGFRWPRGVAEVDFNPPRPACAGARAVQAEAWERAMGLVAQARGLRVRRGVPIRITGAVVVARAQEPPGGGPTNYALVTEYRVDSPGGPLLYRLGTAKRTLGDAVGASLDFLVGFAQGLGDGRTQPPSGGKGR